MRRALAIVSMALAGPACAFLSLFGAAHAEGPDLIFRESIRFKLLTPNDKLATYAIDDPLIENVVCHYTVSEKGGLTGLTGVAEETSDASIACQQYGPIKIKEKFAQGDIAFSDRRSLIFKRMRIVRGCDVKRNVLVYMVYSDKLIGGSPKNSTSSVPIQPWGGGEIARCADFVKN